MKQCNGVEASKKAGSSSSCPWAHGGGEGREKGMASWCHGGAAGAVVKKPCCEGKGEREEEMVVPQAR